MSQSAHTYGPACQLTRTVTHDEVENEDKVPKIKVQFFYSSLLPIDDPLSVVPPPGGSDSKPVKHVPRPFSARDNNSLEEAWMGISTSPVEGKKEKNTDKKNDLFHVKPPSRESQGKEEPYNKKNRKQLKSSGVGSEAVEGDKHSRRHARVDAVKAEKSARGSSLSPTNKDGRESREIEKNDSKEKRSPSRKANPQDGNMDDNIIENRIQGQNFEEHGRFLQHVQSTTHVENEEHLKSEHGEQSGFYHNGLDKKKDKSSKFLRSPNPGEGKQVGSEIDSKEDYFANHVRSASPVSSMHGKGQSQENEFESKNLAKGVRPLAPAVPAKGKGKSRKDPSAHSLAADSTTYPNMSEEAGTTGQPFLKFESKYGETPQTLDSPALEVSDNSHRYSDPHKSEETEFTKTEAVAVAGCNAQKSTEEQGDSSVIVGISRLHSVKIPSLLMHPIYWSPVDDIATVIRGTWFYKDSMYFVEPAVANQLENGYRELRPWSTTWNDELNSALDVGAAGEEKIVHRLWPKDEVLKNTSSKKEQIHISTNPYCAAKCFHGEPSAEGSVDMGETTDTNIITKKYSSAQVIYKDGRNAFILKKTLQPSAYYGRKPLAKIKRGINVGIHVVRGFDWTSWDKLHSSKKPAVVRKAESVAVASNGDVTECPACQLDGGRPKVKDLCLVVHGIGQKLSERVESFHFTHAINSFRRSVNMELANDNVKKVLRKDFGGMMVLPINWRSNLSFEDGGPAKNVTQESTSADFLMKDITPETIPAVRNMISDVLLDIPFYMSHHKPKIIEALISEANSVYRLWCKNNPEFHDEGRVHIIAHSLGSAMAVDILSKQPTSVPKLDLTSKKINTKHFDFNTANLFFAGSPAAFFLLLEKAKLVPRRGIVKANTDVSDGKDKAITGEVGTYGCMAVENVYNIIHYNDPIAYRLNPTVDAQYATSLKIAQVPSATVGFFQSLGKAMKSMAPGAPAPADLAVGEVTNPPTVARLPSQLELEVHDFTREEIAEKKFCLLNENRQLDWFLSSGGGPLEIQYINMLSAHSSYWASADFIRLVVTECGRKAGQTFPNMRAAKIGHKVKS